MRGMSPMQPVARRSNNGFHRRVLVLENPSGDGVGKSRPFRCGQSPIVPEVGFHLPGLLTPDDSNTLGAWNITNLRSKLLGSRDSISALAV